MKELFLRAYGIPYFTAASSIAFLISAATAGSDVRAELQGATVFSVICLLSSTYCILINMLYHSHNKFITDCHKSKIGQTLSLSLYMANIITFVGALASMVFDQLINGTLLKITLFALTALWVWLIWQVLKETINSDFVQDELKKKTEHTEHSHN